MVYVVGNDEGFFYASVADDPSVSIYRYISCEKIHSYASWKDAYQAGYRVYQVRLTAVNVLNT